MNHSALTLHFYDNLTIKGEITYELDGTYLFLLDPRFVIMKIEDCDGNKLKYKEKKITGSALFGSKKTIEILDSNTKKFVITYCSKKPYQNPPTLSQWVNRYNHFEKNRIALDDGYIAFYPVLIYPDMEQCIFNKPPCCVAPAKVYGLEDFYLANGTAADGYMICHAQCQEINRYKILAFRKGTFFQYTSGNITAITPSEKEKANAEVFAQKSDRVVKWYNENLYSQQPLEKQISLFSHVKIKNWNGFWRDNIIEYDRFLPAETPDTKSIIPHELGHSWCHCTGDFTFTDRLLEEGGAEWSAAIYRLAHDDKEEFERRRAAYIKETARYMKRADRFMKEKDSKKKKRANYLLSAHHAGNYFFNSIYEKYGIDKVRDCILYFVSDKEQRNIDTFLKHARAAESDEVYFFLKEQLDFLLPYCM